MPDAVVDVDSLLAPPTPTAGLAREVAREWETDALFNHSLRSWVWASALGDSLGLDYDAELLYVSSLLHDIGVADRFDSHRIAFEVAGGAAGWTFAAGAGWDVARRVRVAEVIERHMWAEVDPEFDVEGHLLEVATSLDVGGAEFDKWDPQVLLAVVDAVPRLDFADSFAASIHDQAVRKPHSNAVRVDTNARARVGGEKWAAFLKEHGRA